MFWPKQSSEYCGIVAIRSEHMHANAWKAWCKMFQDGRMWGSGSLLMNVSRCSTAWMCSRWMCQCLGVSTVNTRRLLQKRVQLGVQCGSVYGFRMVRRARGGSRTPRSSTNLHNDPNDAKSSLRVESWTVDVLEDSDDVQSWLQVFGENAFLTWNLEPERPARRIPRQQQ